MTVVEEQRCRGTAMGDTAATPTRRHRQPNRQLSLASTPPPPPYRGMPTTQPQSMCVRARPPHAWELPTREKSKIGLGSQVPLLQHYKDMPFSATSTGGGARAPTVEASPPWPEQWRQACCGPEANKGKPTTQARGSTNCGPNASSGKARKPWQGARLLQPEARQRQTRMPSSPEASQLRPEGQQWQGLQALAMGKPCAARKPAQASPHAPEPRGKPTAARRPTMASLLSPPPPPPPPPP